MDGLAVQKGFDHRKGRFLFLSYLDAKMVLTCVINGITLEENYIKWKVIPKHDLFSIHRMIWGINPLLV